MHDIYYIGYMTSNNKKSSYLIINNENGCIRESNADRYLTIFPTNKNRDTLKNHEKSMEENQRYYLINK